MNTDQTQAVVKAERTDTNADMFFDRIPVVSDWNWVYVNIANLDGDTLVDAIQKLEPLTPGDVNEHTVWVKQQVIRLILRHKEGLPLTGPTCPRCGTRKSDPVLKECLECAEFSHQMPYLGNRGSCVYLHPTYDVQTNTWGIAHHFSWDEQTILLWLAKGFSSRHDASMALYPIGEYERWLERQDRGVGKSGTIYQDIVDVEWLLKNRDKIPFDPAGFRNYLHAAITAHMTEARNILKWATRTAVRDYERENNT